MSIIDMDFDLDFWSDVTVFFNLDCIHNFLFFLISNFCWPFGDLLKYRSI